MTKSTVPVGTADEGPRRDRGGDRHVPLSVCSNPEFLKEGAAIDDFMKPDRVVIGVDSDEAREVLGELYAPFVRTGNPILFMDIASAEVTKYAANAMLATRISFMNQIAELCERVGADVKMVRQGIGSDRRIGPAFLFPGPGYGGSCFPKDVKALVRHGRATWGSGAICSRRSRRSTSGRSCSSSRSSCAPLGEKLGGKRVADLGAGLQGGDRRHAREPVDPAGRPAASAGGAQVQAHDPEAMESAHAVLATARVRQAIPTTRSTAPTR